MIFGSNGGLGKAIGDYFVNEATYSVLRLYRNNADIVIEEEVEKLFTGLFKMERREDQWHIINATGACHNGTIHSMNVNDFGADLNVNVRGSLLLLKYAAQCFRDHPGSSVTLLSSVVARTGVYGASSYGTAKAAIAGLVRSASKEFARMKCRVNALELGYFDRGMIDLVPQKFQDNLLREIPLGRFGTKEDIGAACEFAISCQYLTGAVVPVNGGLL